jgi:DNA-binding NarL/FixJ family response regulator
MVTSARPTVVIADDHAPLRGAVRESLEAGEFEVVAEAPDAQGAVEAVERLRPDVALLDIHMPGSGIGAARAISEISPDTAIVMLTASDDDADLFDSLRAGAGGYLLKTTGHDDLPGALRGVLSGAPAMPPALVARILEEFRTRPRRRFRANPAVAKLTPREWEIMEMLEGGATTDEVARRLFVSPTTVRVHVSTVLRKLRVRDRKSAFDILRQE